MKHEEGLFKFKLVFFIISSILILVLTILLLKQSDITGMALGFVLLVLSLVEGALGLFPETTYEYVHAYSTSSLEDCDPLYIKVYYYQSIAVVALIDIGFLLYFFLG